MGPVQGQTKHNALRIINKTAITESRESKNKRQKPQKKRIQCTCTHTQMEEGEANRSGTKGSTACTYGESGPSCRHPHGGYAHTQEEVQRTQQHIRQTNNKKGDPRTPRGLLVHGKCSQYSSHKQFVLLFLDLFFAATIKSE
ncbi:hypothetical protein TCSYLVIO_000915 [Trypanosoma cruzi]|nr:hypothetical protein TCSYLVIO_000915 [Trypanosoma cruzi]